MSFEAYSVAIRLSIVDQVSPVLRAYSRSLAATGRDVDSLQKQFLKLQRVGEVAKVGGILAGAGFGMLGLLKGPINEAIEYGREVGKLQQMGLGAAQIAEAQKFVKATDIMGTSMRERMQLFAEAQGAFRQSGKSGMEALNDAKIMMPVMAAYKTAVASLDGEKQAAAGGQLPQLNKIVDIMGGLNDPKRAMQVADSVFKAVQSSGKMVSNRDLRLFMTMAGVAASNMSDKAIFAGLEPIIGEFGGSRVGVALRTAYSRTHGNMATAPSLLVNEALRLGIWDKDKVTRTKGGSAHFLHGSPMNAALAKLQETDLPAFIAQMNKVYEAHGITSMADKAREDIILFGSVAGGVFEKIRRQLPTVISSMQGFDHAQGLAAVNKSQANSPQMRLLDFHRKLEDLKLIIGQQVLPSMTPLIAKMADLALWLSRHPALVENLTVSFVGLASAMSISGTVLLLTAGFSALRIAIQTLGPLLGGLGGLGRTAVGSAATSKLMDYLVFAPWQSLAKAGGSVARLASPFTSAIAGWFGSSISKLAGPIRAGFARLAAPVIQGLTSASSMLASRVAPILGPALAWIGRAVMFGLRAIPVIGWALTAVAVGVYVVRHWDTIKAELLAVWSVIKQAAGATWSWVSDQLKWAWDGLKSGLKSFVGFYLDQWQWLFNKLIGGINSLLPAAMQLKQAHFADDFNRNDASYSNEGRGHMSPDTGSRYIAPPAAQIPPLHAHTYLDGRKIAEVVSHHQAKQASRGLGTGGFDPNLSMSLVGQN